MSKFREPVIGFSVLPTIPVLWIGGVIAFDGFWNAMSGDYVQLMQLLMWLFGAFGTIGLVMASLESTYVNRTRRVIAVFLIACGVVAIILSAHYASNSVEIMNSGIKTNKTDYAILYVCIFIWILLLCPLFSGVRAVKKCLASGSM